jgi:hypothetical protein
MRDASISRSSRSNPMLCALCLSYGLHEPGEIPAHGGFPICREHWAACKERTSKPPPLRTVTLPLSAEERYLNAVLLGEIFPLSNIAGKDGGAA